MSIGYKGEQRRGVALGGSWGRGSCDWHCSQCTSNPSIFGTSEKVTASEHQRRRRQCRKIWFSAFYALELKWGLQYQNVCLWFIATQRQQPLHNLSHSRRAATATTIAATKWLWVRQRMELPTMTVRVNVNMSMRMRHAWLFTQFCRFQRSEISIVILYIHRSVLFIACPRGTWEILGRLRPVVQLGKPHGLWPDQNAIFQGGCKVVPTFPAPWSGCMKYICIYSKYVHKYD